LKLKEYRIETVQKCQEMEINITGVSLMDGYMYSEFPIDGPC